MKYVTIAAVAKHVNRRSDTVIAALRVNKATLTRPPKCHGYRLTEKEANRMILLLWPDAGPLPRSTAPCDPREDPRKSPTMMPASNVPSAESGGMIDRVRSLAELEKSEREAHGAYLAACVEEETALARRRAAAEVWLRASEAKRAASAELPRVHRVISARTARS